MALMVGIFMSILLIYIRGSYNMYMNYSDEKIGKQENKNNNKCIFIAKNGTLSYYIIHQNC